MARSIRLLAMLQSLRNRRRPVTSAELSREFGVSERTLYRDLATLRGQGAGIEGSPGLGYVLRPDYFLPPLMLNPEEADAVTLGLRFVLQRGDPPLADAARTAAAKIAAVLPAKIEQGARLNGLAAAPAGDANPAVARIRQALRHARKLSLDYTDAEGRRTSRTVWPVVLGFFEGAEVLAGWCELRGGFRHFRLDRLHDVQMLSERLPRSHWILLAEWQSTNPEVTF